MVWGLMAAIAWEQAPGNDGNKKNVGKREIEKWAIYVSLFLMCLSTLGD